MASFVRRIAALNAVFQCLVGLISIMSPSYAAVLFKLDTARGAGAVAGTMAVSALIRMFGGLLFCSGLASACIAYRPDANPWLPPLVAVWCLVNVGADTLVCASGEMKFSQLGVGMILQVLLALSLLGYTLQPRRRAAIPIATRPPE